MICFLTRGIAYAELGQFDDALTDLDHAAELAPDLYAVYLNRGAVRLSHGQDADALADFNRAAELRPASAGPFINIAEVHRLNDRFDQAETALGEAINRSATSAKAYHQRGLTRLTLNKPAEARDDFTKAMELDLSSQAVAEAWKQIGTTWHRSGDHQQALSAYDKALVADADDPRTHRLRGEALLELKRDEEAVEAFDRFLKLDDPVADVLRARSVALAKMGRHRDAMESYTLALHREESANMLVRRGWTYLLQGQRLAIEDFSRAIAANPNSAHAWNGRGYARVLQGDYGPALSDAERGLKQARIQAQTEGPSAWAHLYNPATIYAQAIEKVQIDASRTKPQQEALASQMATRAIAILIEAIKAAGPEFRNLIQSTIQSDTSLQPLRDRQEFKDAFGGPTP